MSSWVSVLEQLAELDLADFDPDDLADEQLRQFLPLAQIGINRLTALQTRAVAAGDGAAGAARRRHGLDEVLADRALPDLRPRGGRPGPRRAAAGAPAGAGRRLRRRRGHPAHVAGGHRGGHPRPGGGRRGNGIDLATTDAVLTEAARTLGPEDTAKAVRRWVAGIDPDGALDDAAGLPRIFRMAVSAGGRIYLSGHLDPVGGETVHTALEALMNGDRPAGDLRTHGERMGDALVELARRALRAGDLPTVRGAAAQVRVVIDWFALCAARGAPGVAGGELPFAGPITPETARRLACDAGVVRMLTDPAGLPLDVGQEQRSATAAIRRGHRAARRALRVHRLHRPGRLVRRPPRPSTGPTAARPRCENGALLCERHHTAVHEGGFTIARDPGTASGTPTAPTAARSASADRARRPAGAGGPPHVSGGRAPARRTGSPRRPERRRSAPNAAIGR